MGERRLVGEISTKHNLILYHEMLDDVILGTFVETVDYLFYIDIHDPINTPNNTLMAAICFAVSMERCPKCGAGVIRDDRPVYTLTGELDQDVFWKCQGCGLEW